LKTFHPSIAEDLPSHNVISEFLISELLNLFIYTLRDYKRNLPFLKSIVKQKDKVKLKLRILIVTVSVLKQNSLMCESADIVSCQITQNQSPKW
jgi:hypothetical protein